MPMSLRRILRLTLFGSLVCVAGCQTPKPPVFQNLPPLADLAVEAEPAPGIETLTSAKAAADYDVSVEAWGVRGWATVARICRWAKANGAKVDCPKP